MLEIGGLYFVSRNYVNSIYYPLEIHAIFYFSLIFAFFIVLFSLRKPLTNIYIQYYLTMKNILITLSCLLLFFACTSDSANSSTEGNAITAPKAISTSNSGGPAESPDIALSIKNITPGKVYLIGTFTGQNYRADSTQVDASGNVRFKRNEPYKPGMFYVVFPNNLNLQLLLDKDQTMSIVADANDIVETIKVTGNTDTQLLYENLVYERNHRDQIDPINQNLNQVKAGTPEHQKLKAQQDALISQRQDDLEKIFQKYPNTFFTNFKRAGQNPLIKDVRRPNGSVDVAKQIYLYRTEFWDNVAFDDERLLYTPVINNKLTRYMEKLTTQHPDSINQSASFLVDKSLNYPEYFKYFANYITLKYEPTKTELMDSEKVYVHMIQKYFTKERAVWSDSMTVQGLQTRAYEMSGSLTGNKGPDVKANDPNGQLKSIYELKSDYIIVYLYNPTCEHCMIETPKLVQYYNQNKNKGIDVFAIGIDTNDKEWKDYIKKNGMTWTNVHDPSNRSIYAKYFVDITPEIYVLNKDRTIIAKNLKVSQIEQVIQKDKGL